MMSSAGRFGERDEAAGVQPVGEAVVHRDEHVGALLLARGIADALLLVVGVLL